MARKKRRSIPLGLRFDVLKRDNFTCRYCGRAAPAVEVRIDHVVPVAAGGKNTISNLVTSCEACNAGKGAKLLPPKPLATPDASAMHCGACKGPQPHVMAGGQVACLPCLRSGRRHAGDEAGFVVGMWEREVVDVWEGAPELQNRDVRKLTNHLARADLLDAISAVSAKIRDHAISLSGADRYFYGICWRIIRQRKEAV